MSAGGIDGQAVTCASLEEAMLEDAVLGASELLDAVDES